MPPKVGHGMKNREGLSATDHGVNTPETPSLEAGEVPQMGVNLNPEIVQNLDLEPNLDVFKSEVAKTTNELRHHGSIVAENSLEGLLKRSSETIDSPKFQGDVDLAKEPEIDAGSDSQKGLGSALPVRENVIKRTEIATNLIGTTARLGERPDGTYVIAIDIREGMIDAIRQWSEAESKTPEVWLSELVGSYLEAWGSPARSR